MTTFYDIPEHLRDVIYKKAHLLEVRERISKFLARRAKVYEYKTLLPDTSLNLLWTVNLKVNDAKNIYIEVHAFNESSELIVVDVCDYTDVSVRVHHVCNTMNIFIGTEHSTRHSLVRSWTEGIVLGDEQIHIQWFDEDRRSKYP